MIVWLYCLSGSSSMSVPNVSVLHCVALRFVAPPERFTKCGPEHEVIEVRLILCLYSILIYLTRLTIRLMFKKEAV